MVVLNKLDMPVSGRRIIELIELMVSRYQLVITRESQEPLSMLEGSKLNFLPRVSG